MSVILNIETATEVCSVCLSENGQILSLKESSEPNSHSSLLTLLIQDIFKDVSFSIDKIDAIAVSEGPGSYTGLRIGVSVAKGLCYSLEKPLLSVSTLKAMAFGAIDQLADDQILYCPMIDARRMEVYTALYDSKLNEILAPQPKIIDTASFGSFTTKHKIVFFGSGAVKCSSIFSNSNCIFIEPFKNSASHLFKLSEKYLSDKIFSEIAYYEPAYLKKFIPFKN